MFYSDGTHECMDCLNAMVYINIFKVFAFYNQLAGGISKDQIDRLWSWLKDIDNINCWRSGFVYIFGSVLSLMARKGLKLSEVKQQIHNTNNVGLILPEGY